MFRKKTIVFSLLAIACMATFAYGQEKVENRQLSTVSGTLTAVDSVGNIIVVKIDDKLMAFSVPDDAMITAGAEKISVEDLEDTDSVTIQYYSPSPGQYVAVSIMDNNNIMDEW